MKISIPEHNFWQMICLLIVFGVYLWIISSTDFLRQCTFNYKFMQLEIIFMWNHHDHDHRFSTSIFWTDILPHFSWIFLCEVVIYHHVWVGKVHGWEFKEQPYIQNAQKLRPALANPRGHQGCEPSVQFLSFSCRLWQKSRQIIGSCPKLRGWCPPADSKILDPSLDPEL